LCRKNDGHLIRVVGPSFDLVSGWAAQGVPLKVVLGGIDRYFERYYRQGPRRRPVRIDFCEADVLDLFDEWRRAIGLTRASVTSDQLSIDRHRSSVSLPEHLKRVLIKLSSARATVSFGPVCDATLERLAAELDVAVDRARGIRGEARQALIDRLVAVDRELLDTAHAALDVSSSATLAREADDEIAAFRASMTSEAFAKARQMTIDRLVRDHFQLPVIAYQ
jgi:hypothetical protein